MRAGGGYATVEVRHCYVRARDLARQIGDTDYQFMAQLLLWTSYLTRAAYKEALDIALQLHSLAQNTGNKSQMAEANLALGMVRLYQGEFGLAHEHLEAIINSRDPREKEPLLSPLGLDIRLTALISSARALWYLGYPDQALQRSQQAIAQTEELDHPYSLALALGMAGCMVHLLRREYHIAGIQAEKLMKLAVDEGFDFYAAWAGIVQGRAQVFCGQMSEGLANLQQGLSASREIGQRSNRTFALALLADVGAGDQDPLEVLAVALEVAADFRVRVEDPLDPGGAGLRGSEDDERALGGHRWVSSIASRRTPAM